ncbi:ABC transporter substrate-binding protein [Streptomyces sp. RFCAC02]|uniref:ABC transporter substrate-binding protein n=1 Tax=Streptomyces sp. RFCAC02 TaxID=2499143 RepID=UPI00101F64F0|nr:ABC transporter substrate-binding protein [Streptomyces sp. RFCAC02]
MRPLHRGGPRAAALAGALLIAATACGGLGSTDTSGTSDGGAGDVVPELAADQQVEITFESYNLAQSGAWSDTINGLLDEFQEEHPNITVHAQPPQGGQSDGSNTISSVQTQLLAGSPPDVAQLTFDGLDFAVNGLHAKSLDDLFGTDAVQAQFDGEHPYHERARTLGDWDGETYGVPYVFSTPVLYYNADLFTAAGLDPDQPPTTWEEVADAATAIGDATGSQGAVVGCLDPVGSWCMQGIIRSAGGSVISDDRESLTFGEGAAVDAVAGMADLVEQGAVADLDSTQGLEAFGRGDAAMLLQSSAVQGSLTQSAEAGGWDLRAAAMPGFTGQDAVPTNSGSALFVFSDDAAKQRAAWELITFLTSDHAYERIATGIGYLPLRTGLVDDGLSEWAADNPLLAPNLEQLDRLEPWQSFPGDSFVQITDLWMDAVQSAVFDGADPAGVLGDAQERAQDLL